jgi:methylmalonyl-CoA mutase
MNFLPNPKNDLSMKEKHQQKLLEEFEHPSYETWLELVEKQLKGAPFEKKLVRKPSEGFSIQPIYRKEDGERINLPVPGEFPYSRGTRSTGLIEQGWEISQPYHYPEAAELGQAVVSDVERGITSVLINLDENTGKGLDPDQGLPEEIGKSGLSLFCRDDLGAAFDRVDLNQVSLMVRPHLSFLPFYSLLISYLDSRSCSKEKLKGCLIADPLSCFAANGSSGHSLTRLYREMAACINGSAKHTPGFRTLGIDVFPYAEAGASAVQELAIALSTAMEYFRGLLAHGIGIDEAAGNTAFFIPVGSDFFMSIAKLRAARMLWAKVVKSCGGSKEAQKMVIHAGTALYNKTVYDPYVNLLRLTTEAYSAVLGGSDSVAVAPFDDVLGLPDDFSRRISRNIQMVLKEECHGHRIIDPAGGSWYLENLTENLAEKSWAEFQKIEAFGGMAEALKKGALQQDIQAVVSQNTKETSQRKKVVVGTNMFPNMEEEPLKPKKFDYAAFAVRRKQEAEAFKKVATQDPERVKKGNLVDTSTRLLADQLLDISNQGATLGMMTELLQHEPQDADNIEKLSTRRLAEDYEVLRANAEAYRQAEGNYPRVFLANMGPLRQHKARADYSAGFLQPGGFEMIQGAELESVESAIEASLASGAKIVVVCSTDETYPELVPALTAGIKKGNADISVVLAGYPVDHIETFQKAGVDAFIHLKANNLETLIKLQEKAGVES